VQTDDEGNPTKYKSQARYRDHDGHVRPVSAYAKTKTAAKRALLTKVQDRSKTGQSGELTAMHKITHHPSSPRLKNWTTSRLGSKLRSGMPNP
jgi:hypothetical protein